MGWGEAWERSLDPGTPMARGGSPCPPWPLFHGLFSALPMDGAGLGLQPAVGSLGLLALMACLISLFLFLSSFSFFQEKTPSLPLLLSS